MKKFLTFLKVVLFGLLAIAVGAIELNILTFFAGLMNTPSDVGFLLGLLGSAGSFALALYAIMILGQNIFRRKL
jgi:hypothetical protein